MFSGPNNKMREGVVGWGRERERERKGAREIERDTKSRPCI